MSERHAILIGTSRFVQEPTLPELEGPGRDVAALVRLLGSAEIGGFELRQFVNRPSGDVLRTLETVISSAEIDTTLVIYYSGHTLVDGAGRLFLATEDTDLGNLPNSSLPLAFVQQLLKRSEARNVVVILDCSYMGGVAGRAADEGAIEQRLRTLRTEVSQDLHLFARRGAVQSVAAREGGEGGDVMGAMTRSIVNGLSTGAADRNGDNRITASDLNLYLAEQFGDERPLWAGPLEGADPVLVDNPHPIAGVDIAAPEFAAVEVATPRRGRRPLLALALVVVVATTLGVWLAYGPEIPERRLELGGVPHTAAELPIEPAVIADLSLLREMGTRQRWIEHRTGATAPIGSRYPSAVSVLTDATLGAGGRFELMPRQFATVEFADVIFAVAVVFGRGLNLADGTVELVDGTEYHFEVETFHAGQEFFGVASPQPIGRIRFETTTGTLAIEELFFYATKEHAPVETGR